MSADQSQFAGRVALVAGSGPMISDIARAIVDAGARAFVVTTDARAIGAIVAAVGHNYADGFCGEIEDAVLACTRRFGRLDVAIAAAALSPEGDASAAIGEVLALRARLAEAALGAPVATIVDGSAAAVVETTAAVVVVGSLDEAAAIALRDVAGDLPIIVIERPLA